MQGYRNENGWVWPKDDIECAKAVFRTLDDCDAATHLGASRDLAVQAGGNMGVWAKHLAATYANVITFEPCPINFRALVVNTADCPNIMNIPAALSNKAGWCGLDRQEGNAGAHQIIAKGFEAPTLTLDSLRLPALSFLCLDIEGAEWLALDGARRTIAEFQPVILIEDKGLSERYGIRQGECEKLLAELGYEVAARRRRDVILVAK